MNSPSTRRHFLATTARSLGGGWLALRLPAVSALAACARDAARLAEPLLVLTRAEAHAMSAFAVQILPADDGLPGADEAGALYFVDRGLDTHFRDLAAPVREGLADLDRRAHAAQRGARGFGDLPPERQRELMHDVEETEFFFLARMLVLMAVFSDPSYGGNRGGVGWALLQIQPHAVHEPPFGHYDAGYAANGGA